MTQYLLWAKGDVMRQPASQFATSVIKEVEEWDQVFEGMF
jgi:hypothetical protein